MRDPVQKVLRRLTQLTRPLALRSAGKEGSSTSVVRHVGRRSGRTYQTPVVAVEHDDSFLIALPYGERTDWLKNVLARGSATIVTGGRTYEVDEPEVVPMAKATVYFRPREQRMHRQFGVESALRVRRVPASSAGLRQRIRHLSNLHPAADRIEKYLMDYGGSRIMMSPRKACVVGALAAGMMLLPATSAWATQNPTTGQPGTTAGFNCGTSSAPVEPGHAANAPGSAFNETSPGTAGTVYAGNGPGSTAHAGSTAAVSQYDAACRQLSSH